jgi:hypothetical protein
MKTRLLSFIRGLAGFIVGGLVAAVSAGFALVSVYPISDDSPGVPNYGPMALTVVAMAAFLSGGFIGRRGFTSEFSWRPIVIAYVCMTLLCALSDASFQEGAAMIGFVTVGIVASIVVSLAAFRWLPRKGLNDAA